MLAGWSRLSLSDLSFFEDPVGLVLPGDSSAHFAVLSRGSRSTVFGAPPRAFVALCVGWERTFMHRLSQSLRSLPVIVPDWPYCFLGTGRSASIGCLFGE